MPNRARRAARAPNIGRGDRMSLMARPSPDGRGGRGPASDHRSTGYEPFAVEHHRHDRPAESVEEQRRGEADGEGERRVDHVERDERRHRDRQETRQRAELRRGSDVGHPGGDRGTDPDRPAAATSRVRTCPARARAARAMAGPRTRGGMATRAAAAVSAVLNQCPALSWEARRGCRPVRGGSACRAASSPSGNPAGGAGLRMAGRPGTTRSPVNPGARPAASPALADLVPPWVRLRDHHHGRDISPIPTRSTPSQSARKGEE